MSLAPGEHPVNLRNVLSFVRRHPASLAVLASKVKKRLFDGAGRYTEEENLDWILSRKVAPSSIAMELAPELWNEAIAFGEEARHRASTILASVPFDMGAGGDYEFMYWVTRFQKPRVIVETGVSAGWTSYAFLSAIRANGFGELHSSDFPLFKVKHPERYVGIIVPNELRLGWNLHTTGDRAALPRILSSVSGVDLFHYDSDKSVSGRDFGIQQAKRKLNPGGLMFMDDIRNDSWFREHVEASGEPFTILDGRCGMLGEL